MQERVHLHNGDTEATVLYFMSLSLLCYSVSRELWGVWFAFEFFESMSVKSLNLSVIAVV